MKTNWLGNQKTKLMGELNIFIDNLINERNSLADKLRDYNKEEEMAKVLKESERIRINSLHILSEKEKLDADAFRQEHWEKCKGNTSYILTGTGIGMGVDVKCNHCGAVRDITDVSRW